MALLHNPYSGDDPDDDYPRGIDHTDWLWDGPCEIPCQCYPGDPDCRICDGSGWEKVEDI